VRVETVTEPNAVLDEREAELKKAIAVIQRQYAEAVNPFLQELAQLDALRPRKLMVYFEVGEEIPQHIKDQIK